MNTEPLAASDGPPVLPSRQSRWPGSQRVTSVEDLANITFVDDMAEIEVPVEAIPHLPFKNDYRSDDPRLAAVRDRIRWFGYNNAQPIIVRIGRRGRWVVVDGGHRLTAAQQVSREILPNLFGRKVGNIHMILYRTPLSDTRTGDPAGDQDLPG